MTGLIIIGDEILSGRRPDQHLAKAIALLAERGMTLSWARYVGDEPDRLTADLRHALDSSEVVFSFGGIGATPDDHTRACSGRAWGRPLVLHPEARALILERGRVMAEQEGRAFDPGSADSLRRLDMGTFPEGASLIPNPYNQIPGFSLDGRVHFLPGFPIMAWPMMGWVLDHLHPNLHHLEPVHERCLIVLGALESRLTPLMIEIEQRFAPVKVFSLPSEDHPVHGRHIELGLKGPIEEVNAAFVRLQQGLNDLGALICTKKVQ